MGRDMERRKRVQGALREARMEAVVCALPTNVLLLTGYWPVVGTSLALAAQDGRTLLLVPEDEHELAVQGGADEVHTFQPASLHDLRTIDAAIGGPLADAARLLGIEHSRMGYESGGTFEPSSYAAMHLYGARLPELLRLAAPSATLAPADELLMGLRTVKTPYEVSRIRTACQIAAQAFREGRRQLCPGLRETEVAVRFGAPLGTVGTGDQGGERAGGFTYCMSGPNAARAYGAYARSRARHITPGDLVLVHCNSYVDGYWTDITRTYCMSEADARPCALYAAVLAASAAAVNSIRPGVPAMDVDRAARELLAERGFGDQFKHSTGHGVGFAAINHNARPRLHPKSNDVLAAGMVFNVEPAIYLDGYGGLRHCTMVAVTETGAEVLTPFQVTREELLVGDDCSLIRA